MAHHAECAAALDSIKGLLGSSGIMACLTGASKNRGMETRLEEVRLRRGMGVMTAQTGLLLYGIPSVGLLERRCAALMTGKAQFRGRLYEKILLARGVCKMAGPAPLLLQYPVDDFIFKFFLLVAAETEFAAFSLQEVIRLRCVRVVAEDTVSPLQPRMHVCLVQPQLFLCMTIEAECISLLLEKELRYPSVPKMAVLTIPVRHDLMNMLHLKVFVHKGLVTIEARLRCKSLLGKRGGDEGKGHYHGCRKH